MKRSIFTLCLLVFGCASSSSLLPGHVADKSSINDATVIVWRNAYGRTDDAPLVYVVEGYELTCTDPHSGLPGFDCPTVGCRNGCTASPRAVHISARFPWSQSSLAHELWHVVLIRQAVETELRTPLDPSAFIGMMDRDHKGPGWRPGGDVDKANVLLMQRGL